MRNAYAIRWLDWPQPMTSPGADRPMRRWSERQRKNDDVEGFNKCYDFLSFYKLNKRF